AVCIRDINKASDIIDSAVKAGGNTTRVQGISFAIDKPESALAEAREKAYANATMKAEQYAKLSGVTLGSPLHISEGSDMPPVPMPYAEMRTMKAAMADSASTPVQAGEQDVSVTVDVMFGIQ
ncbi:MAG: SIMPL domain-containing protein, partial [Methyloglobulus sp.]|nr:SIMPL domain-containing protein [Methyloglobulus sp.]